MNNDTTTEATTGHDHNNDYLALMASIASAMVTATNSGAKIFTTEATAKDGYPVSLYDLILAWLPEGEIRQHYNCAACRGFVNKYGGLVTIDEHGKTSPVLFPFTPAPSIFDGGIALVRDRVARARVTGVFVSKKKILGTPSHGGWSHLHTVQHQDAVFESRKLTAGQRAAELIEDKKMLAHALAEYTLNTASLAVGLLTGEALFRGEKVLGVAKWFQELHKSIAEVRGRERENLIWRAVASAPAGFCHVRSSMIGTLLDDLAAKMDLVVVSRRFREKMDPMQYMRPTATLKEGNIDAAEKFFDRNPDLKLAMDRRYAGLDEVPMIWRPKQTEKATPTGGVFAHLRAKDSTEPVKLAPEQMTWAKFVSEVLPRAERIQFKVPVRARYIALTTCVHENAGPVLQWDSLNHRNQVSWFVHKLPHESGNFNLSVGEIVDVVGLSFFPYMWEPNTDFSHQGWGAIAYLDGAKVVSGGTALGLFPSLLRSDLHEFRATIERHNMTTPPKGREGQNACGIDMRHFSEWYFVTTDDGTIVREIHIDRLD